MKLAIMQPYFFPYLGYYQLVNCVDKFIFCDDVNYIKNGWINRNRILKNNQSFDNKPFYITVRLSGASQNKLINEIPIIDNRDKLKKTIQVVYKKAPMYESVWPVIEDCLDYNTCRISELAMFSVKRVCQYLGIDKQFEVCSTKYADTKGMEKSERIKMICKKNDADTYVNAIGGQKLYNKKDFKKSGINLFFIKSGISEYEHFSAQFIPNLSIIDVIMFNSRERIRDLLKNYKLI